VPVRQVRRQDHRAAGRDDVPVHLVPGLRAALEGPGRREQPQRLLEHGTEQRQGRDVRLVDGPPAQHRVELGEDAAAHVRVPGQQAQRPGQGGGGRLVTGQQEGHHLVPHLPVTACAG
jgi:hypothetical protein